MRKWRRLMLRIKTFNIRGDVEVFRYLWKRLRMMSGKWNWWNEKHQKASYDIRYKQHKRKVNAMDTKEPWKITKTGNKVVGKPSIWNRIKSFFKKLFGGTHDKL